LFSRQKFKIHLTSPSLKLCDHVWIKTILIALTRKK
jgi:hypothetical protein